MSMSHESQWDPSAAITAGELASEIAENLRVDWMNDVYDSLPDDAESVFDLGNEVDGLVMEEIRGQVLDSFEDVITRSGLASVYTGQSASTGLTWEVTCKSDHSYDCVPELRRGRFGCIATVCGTALQQVQLPIHVLAPVQDWEVATSLKLSSALKLDTTIRAQLGRSSQEPAVAAMLRNRKSEVFAYWASQVSVPLEEDRMWISAVITARPHEGQSLKVKATYSGWIWADDNARPLKSRSVTVLSPGNVD